MSKIREIPLEAKEIQTGLWLHEYKKNICGNIYNRRELYSSEGYCFFDKTKKYFNAKIENEEIENEEIEITNEEELKKLRIYMQYASLGLNANIRDYISVKIEEGFEII